jgi:hypothetical protein
MKGYVILNQNGSTLTEKLWWGPGEGFVFSEGQKNTILRMAVDDDWTFKPVATRPAEYRDGKVYMLGGPSPLKIA